MINTTGTINSIKLLATFETVLICSLVRYIVNYQTSKPINAVTPPSQAMMTLSKRFIFCLMATINIPDMVATYVAMMMGIKTSVGSFAWRIARWAMMVTGNNCNPEVSITRYIIWALEAVSLSGFNSCKLSIAFKPSGVA